jgi:hypothetical protein
VSVDEERIHQLFHLARATFLATENVVEKTHQLCLACAAATRSAILSLVGQ